MDHAQERESAVSASFTTDGMESYRPVSFMSPTKGVMTVPWKTL